MQLPFFGVFVFLGFFRAVTVLYNFLCFVLFFYSLHTFVYTYIPKRPIKNNSYNFGTLIDSQYDICDKNR